MTQPDDDLSQLDLRLTTPVHPVCLCVPAGDRRCQHSRSRRSCVHQIQLCVKGEKAGRDDARQPLDMDTASAIQWCSLSSAARVHPTVSANPWLQLLSRLVVCRCATYLSIRVTTGVC